MMQDKSDRLKNFLGRFDYLCVRAGIKTAEACRLIGVARSLFYELRSGKREVTDKIMNRLGIAEREAGISYPSPSKLGISGIDEEEVGKIVDGFTFEQRAAVLIKLFGSNPAAARNLKRLILVEVARRTKEFFGSVRHLAEWAAKAADQIPDKETAVELKFTSAEVIRNEPEAREWLQMLLDQDSAALAEFEPPPDE